MIICKAAIYNNHDISQGKFLISDISNQTTCHSMLSRIFHSTIIIIAIVTISLVLSSNTPQNIPCNFDDIVGPKEVGKSTNVKYVKHKNDIRTKRSMMEEGELHDGGNTRTKRSLVEEVYKPSSRIKRNMMEEDEVHDVRNIRTKRSIMEEEEEEQVFEPIRITMFIHDLDDYVDTLEVERLERVSRSAVSIIKKLLSVIPVSGPLVISRSPDACLSVYPNNGQCAAVSNSYIGEKCLDDFLIPDDHLGGFTIYDESGQPIELYSEGLGIPNTDTVLYIKKQHTPQCDNTPEIVAYALYCKLDQNNRPIAGVVNFCPSHLQDELYDEDKFILLTVHEIFHILGFSCNLFDKFKDCSYKDSETGVCLDRNVVVTSDLLGQSRMITPAVMSAASDQFGCMETEYLGGPLENKPTSSGFATATCLSSHWETRFMSGSIMAPSIGKPHQTFLDRMTLAVFEDSGWYQVNYEYAEDLPWGKDQGCHFGDTDVCTAEKSEFFCNSSISSGCHYLHRDKGACSTNDFLEGCSTYITDKMGQCSIETITPQVPTMDGEVYSPNSRCYVSNLVPQGGDPCNPVGRCYLTRCNYTSESYEIKVADGTWTECSNGTNVEIPEYDGKVRCPSYTRVCSNRSSILDLVDPCCQTTPSMPPSVHTIASSLPTSSYSLFVTMEFSDLNYEQISDQEQQGVFVESLRDTVCQTTNIMRNQVIILEVGKELMFVTVTFNLSYADGPMINEDIVSVDDAYADLERAVSTMMFKVLYMGVLYTATSIRIVASLPTTTTTIHPSTTYFTTSHHKKAGLAIGCILGITALLVLVAIVYVCFKKKNSNAIGPSPEDTAEMHASQRAPAVYIVSPAFENGGGTAQV